MTISIPITEKMGEALMWGLAQIGDKPRRKADHPTDPLYVLLQLYPRAEIMRNVALLWPVAYSDFITDDLTPIKKDILRVCVENTSWITSYANYPDSQRLMDEARYTLQDLMTRFEEVGIEINHLPPD